MKGASKTTDKTIKVGTTKKKW